MTGQKALLALRDLGLLFAYGVIVALLATGVPITALDAHAVLTAVDSTLRGIVLPVLVLWLTPLPRRYGVGSAPPKDGDGPRHAA